MLKIVVLLVALPMLTVSIRSVFGAPGTNGKSCGSLTTM